MLRLKSYLHTSQYEAGLYKHEVLMIVNLRPSDLGMFDYIVEECDERFTEEQQQEILAIVEDVLGGGEETHGVQNENGELDGESDGAHDQEPGGDMQMSEG